MTERDDRAWDAEARRVLEPLRVPAVVSESSERVARERDVIVPKLAAMIERLPRERTIVQRWRQVRRVATLSAGGMAAAAALALWFRDGSMLRPGPADPVAELTLLRGQLSNAGQELVTESPVAIASLGRLSTPLSTGAEVLTVGGVKLGLGPDSTLDLAFSESSRRIALNRGSVTLDVPKLAPGVTLSVATPDAVATVHGTRFSVEYHTEDGTERRTCVRVQEGVVSVARDQGTVRLTAGESDGCEASTPVTSATTKGTPTKGGTPSAVRARPGTLDQENELFRRALAAEQAGDLLQARASLERLLSRYPKSPLAGEARRVLARLPEGAAGSARTRSSGAEP